MQMMQLANPHEYGQTMEPTDRRYNQEKASKCAREAFSQLKREEADATHISTAATQLIHGQACRPPLAALGNTNQFTNQTGCTAEEVHDVQYALQTMHFDLRRLRPTEVEALANLGVTDVDSIKLLSEEDMIHGGVRVVTARRIVQESTVYVEELQERYYEQNRNRQYN